MSITKHKIDFDSAAPADNDRIGSFIIGKDGAVVTSTLVGSDEALDVNVVQATGLAIVAEDSAVSSGDNVQLVGLVRQDALATDTSADGDASFMKVNAKGEQYVIDTDGNALLTTIDVDTGSIDTTLSALSLAEDSAAAGGEEGIQSLLVRQDTLASSTSADGDFGSFKSNAKGELYSIDTDNIVQTTAINTKLAALTQVEDAASAGGESGIMLLAVRNDTEGSLVDTDGDFGALQLDSFGRLRIIGDLDVTSTIADDEQDSKNPLKVGSRTFNQDAALEAVTYAFFDFIDGDVSTGADTITETAHGFVNGNVIRLTSGGTLPDGLALLTTYYIVGVTTNTLQLSLTRGGAAVDITAAAGGGTHTLTTVSDRADLMSDSFRRLHMNGAANIAIKNTDEDVTSSAAQVLTAPLSGRIKLEIQNLGTKEVYVGSTSGVTTGNGTQIPKEATATFEWGESIKIFMVSPSGTQDVRFLESA